MKSVIVRYCVYATLNLRSMAEQSVACPRTVGSRFVGVRLGYGKSTASGIG